MSKAENEWRVDGPDKVMGRTLYVDDLRRADLGFEMLHAVIVTSTIAKGRITKINTAKADALQGVRAVMTHLNAPRLRKVLSLSMSEIGDIRPLQTARIHYRGQAVAVIIAEDAKTAQTAAAFWK